jgi:hypothetical protein
MYKTLRLSYTSVKEHCKHAPSPINGVIVVPDDRFIPDLETTDFEFELVSEDYHMACVFYQHCPPKWQRFFPSDRRDQLLSLGCSCCEPSQTKTCTVCDAFYREEYMAYIESTKTMDIMTAHFPRDYITVNQRSYKWVQVSGPRIHWCYYDVDRADYTDYNFGEILLNRLNEGSDKVAGNLTNVDGQQIISGCMLLRRLDSDDGSTPPYEGYTVINGVEYTNAEIFYKL